MGEMQPTVSVIIATYNHSDLLSIAVDSVLAQSYPSVEVIVIDDGSTDDTPDVMQQYTGRVRYIRQENRGVVAARNMGICNASGEFINFLDSDDFFLPGKIERQMQVFKSQPQIGLVHCGFYQVDENGKRLNKVTSFPSDNILRALAIDCFLIVHAPLVRREWFDRVGGFDERLPWEGQHAEDWDLWLRIAKAGCQFAYVREPLIAYRILKSSRMRDVAKMEKGGLGVLDRFFSASDLPDDVVAAKAEAYGLRHLWLGFSYYEANAWDDARRNMAEAFATYPGFERNRGLVLQKIVDAALITRVNNPLAFLDSVLAHLPPELFYLQQYDSFLRSQIMSSLAMQNYAAGDMESAQEQLSIAINLEPSLLDRPTEFHDILCHYAMNLPLQDPVGFANQVLSNLPVEAERFKRIRPKVLGDLNVACAFEDYEQEQWTRTVQHLFAAARHHPGIFRNRGVLSILIRSLLAFLHF